MPTPIGICTYLTNNQTLLSSENYSPEDALVFAELSYFKFEEIFENYRSISISVPRLASEIYNKQAGLSDDEKTFLLYVAENNRFSNCTIDTMAAENETSQWAALTCHINDGTDSAVVAMRGTDSSVMGWTEDLNLAYSCGTNAQKLSAEYINNISAENIYLSGHSKGGNDVTSGFLAATPAARNRILRIDNFDGPGVNSEFMEAYAEEYKELAKKLNNFYPKNSIIGMLLTDNPGNSYFVSCKVRPRYENKGIFGEHDPFSWEFTPDNHFAYTNQSLLSNFVDQTLDDITSLLSQEERAKLIGMMEKLCVPAIIAHKPCR